MGNDSQLSPEQLLQALSVLTQAVKGQMATGGLDGFEPDPTNKVKGWSGISLVKGEDDRPKLADKDYIIKKLALGPGQEMPHDSGGGDYARPF